MYARYASREGRNADGVGRIAVVKHPDQLEAVLLVIEHGFVEDDEQLAIWQRQAIVCAAAERYHCEVRLVCFG